MGDQLPDYDELSDEHFTGPFDPESMEAFDETWDDDYEAQAAALFDDGVIEQP